MLILSTIKQKIVTAFNPIYLEVIDSSAAHADHHVALIATSPGITHLVIVLQSTLFDNIATLARHRMVQEVIAHEFNEIHSISLKLYDSQQQVPTSCAT